MSLQKTNIELERANENLNQFVFIASHDLQEPLRKLQLFVNLLTRAENDLPDHLKNTVGKIGKSAERMSDLIRDVLAFSTVSSIESAYVKTDLNVILQKVLVDLELLISEKRASITIETLPVIRAVPILISQLFNNLLNNSLKFSNKEELAIAISSRTLMPAEVQKHSELNNQYSYCEIVVTDSGVGFEQQFAEKIFEIFQRLKSTTSGTGVGLALCRKIVNIHEGSIRAEGKVDEGARFYIYLPLYNEGGKMSEKKFALNPA